MTNDLVQALKQWVLEADTNRIVKIEFGEYGNPDYENVWIYDCLLMCGAFIKCVEDLEELDLKQKKRNQLEADAKMWAYLNNDK